MPRRMIEEPTKKGLRANIAERSPKDRRRVMILIIENERFALLQERNTAFVGYQHVAVVSKKAHRTHIEGTKNPCMVVQ